MSAHSHSPHDHDHDEAATCCGGDHGHDHGAAHDRAASHGGHGHSHEHLDHPGTYAARATGSPALWATRAWSERAFTVGIGGPVGSGKTALTLKLCEELRAALSLGVCTNDIFTREDAEFLTRKGALPAARIRAVETGGCPHAAIREDVSGNLDALDRAPHGEVCSFTGIDRGAGNGLRLRALKDPSGEPQWQQRSRVAAASTWTTLAASTSR